MLDTNVYADIEADAKFELSAMKFVAQNFITISAVVVAELILGIDRSARERLVNNLQLQMEVAGSLTPNGEDWQTAALAWTRMAPGTVQRRSFWNDLLLAASCARTGTTLVTSNGTDFTRIARHIPVRHVRPWRGGA